MSADTLSGSCYRTNFSAAVCTRYTTSLEQTEFEINNKEDISQWRSLTDILPRKEYVDISGDEPLPGERELPDLPDSPNKETVYVPKRLVRQKSALAPDNRRLVSAPSGDDAWERDSDCYEPTSPDAEPPALPSDLEDDLPVNAYEPDSKKARTEEDDQLLHELKSSTSSTTTKESREYDLHWLQELQQQEGDLHHLFMQCEDVMQIELDVDLPSHRQQKSFESNASAFMVKKMRDSEVVLAKLSNELRELFNRAKSKEVSSFIKAEAVRRRVGSGRIMRARWVLTWKLTPPEDIEEAKREAAINKKSPYTKDGLRKAKARIVLLSTLTSFGLNSRPPAQFSRTWAGTFSTSWLVFAVGHWGVWAWQPPSCGLNPRGLVGACGHIALLNFETLSVWVPTMS